MTDYFETNGLADDDRSDRYAPPQFILMSEPAGRLAYAEVFENGKLVGAIWMSEDKKTIPRAGIVLSTIIDSEQFQGELGMHSLNYSRDSTVDAAAWIEQLTATRDGQSGLAVANENYIKDIDALRAAYWPQPT